MYRGEEYCLYGKGSSVVKTEADIVKERGLKDGGLKDGGGHK